MSCCVVVTAVGLGGSSHVLANGKHVVLCFDSAVFSEPNFDAHEFVSQYLSVSGSAATAISTTGDDESGDGGSGSGSGSGSGDHKAESASGPTALDGGAIIPANAASLETLMRDLQLYGDELKTALVDLLNREYTVWLELPWRGVACVTAL